MTGTTLTDRALIRLSGEGVRDFLQGLVSNDVETVATGHPVWAGLLSPQGKALFDFVIWADGDDLLLDTERAAMADLIRRLAMYRLRRPITIAPEDKLSVHWSREQGGVRDPRLAELGFRWLGPEDGEAEGWPAHRLSLGVAEGRDELGSDQILWLECNARELNGVSFTKGCYVGQENTARMNYRNKVNRRLVVVPAAEPGPRARFFHADLGLAVEHRRIDDLEGAIIPSWLAAAL